MPGEYSDAGPGNGVYIGTSGWKYASWKDDFYAGIAQRDWLRFCARRFTGLEINATFYRLQSSNTFARWCDETPVGFRFALKANRYLIHTKRLNNPEIALQRERENDNLLGKKLAVVLWQFPASFGKTMTRLEGFAQALDAWPETRHALEFRDNSWFDDEVADCLRRHRLAVCLSDAANWPLWEMVTTDLVYVRLHGHTQTYASTYEPQLLTEWARRIQSWRREGHEVHVYFDNDAEGAAPWNAWQLLRMIKQTRGKRS